MLPKTGLSTVQTFGPLGIKRFKFSFCKLNNIQVKVTHCLKIQNLFCYNEKSLKHTRNKCNTLYFKILKLKIVNVSL
jgi:hypothetical protein